MDPRFEIDPIVSKYIRNEGLSPEETAFLHQWMDAEPTREEMLESIKTADDSSMAELIKLHRTNTEKEKVVARLQADGDFPTPDLSLYTLTPKSHPIGRSWRPWLAAASVLAILGIGGWWFMAHRPPPSVPSITVGSIPTDVQPGGSRAILTLADGRKINLDSTANGVLAAQQHTTVSKLFPGQLTYKNDANAHTAPLAYNVLSTPRAGQFSLTLADGTQVWLNNASTLRYPVAFTGADRQVELTGEAYFEIAKDAVHPFRVLIHRDAPDTTNLVEVLGTAFNVMAYGDEPDELTTLLSGSVRCISAGRSTLLRPNEQSVLGADGVLHTVPHVNVQEVTAWKNGYFHFDHSSLENTMRQLARWYDVDVTYQGHFPEQEFMGKIQRNLPLSAVLKGLENDQVHFKLKGRKLTVMP
jgi:transmembrane sensor